MINLSSLSKVIGVYQIKNLINNKIYIGSSINCKVRCRTHYNNLLKNKHTNKKLQNSWNKYKPTDFEITILEIVSDKQRLLCREQYFIDILKPFYNICKIAGNTLGREMTDKTKNKIKLTLTDKYSGTNSFNYKGGYIKTKNKLESKVSSNILNQIKSRQANKSGKKVIQFDSNMILINTWDSIKSASDKLNIQRHAIKQCCEGKARHAGFFIWRYENNLNVEYKYRKNTIQQIDNNYNIVNEFDQIVIAAETLKINRKSIGKALKTGEKYYGFYWRYKTN